jgi:Domain of unknown function (DUF5666)
MLGVRWGRTLSVLLTVLVGSLQTGLAAPAPPAQAEGTITAVEAGAVTLTTRAGAPLRVILTPETTIIQRRQVTLETIRPNDFVGVTAKREADGSLTAVSINIFPPEFKGRIRQAQFVMDTGNIMTNATVFQNVRRIEGRTLYLKLGDGTAVIAVPRDAAVLRLTLARPTDLRAGMTITVRGTAGPDGSLTAGTLTFDLR